MRVTSHFIRSNFLLPFAFHLFGSSFGQIMALTRVYAAATPPNPATFIYMRSIPSRRQAMAQAGIWTGIGISVSFAAGFAKITEKMRPRRMASLPAYGLTNPCKSYWRNRRPEPKTIASTIVFAKKTFPCIMPRLWQSSPMMRLSMKKLKKLVWAKWHRTSECMYPLWSPNEEKVKWFMYWNILWGGQIM